MHFIILFNPHQKPIWQTMLFLFLNKQRCKQVNLTNIKNFGSSRPGFQNLSLSDARASFNHQVTLQQPLLIFELHLSSTICFEVLKCFGWESTWEMTLEQSSGIYYSYVLQSFGLFLRLISEHLLCLVVSIITSMLMDSKFVFSVLLISKNEDQTHFLPDPLYFIICQNYKYLLSTTRHQMPPPRCLECTSKHIRKISQKANMKISYLFLNLITSWWIYYI